eukprot:gene18784-24015_t
MAELHELKVLHRDIKPANILLCFPNGEVSAKLSDFGLAKSFEAHGHSVADSDLKGTLVYMAPELQDRKYSFKSDIFAFGVTLNELLSNAPHFEAIKGLPLFSSKMTIKDDITEQLTEIVTDCQRTKLTARPDFDSL